MVISAPQLEAAEPRLGEQRVVLRGVSWEGYLKPYPSCGVFEFMLNCLVLISEA